MDRTACVTRVLLCSAIIYLAIGLCDACSLEAFGIVGHSHHDRRLLDTSGGNSSKGPGYRYWKSGTDWTDGVCLTGVRQSPINVALAEGLPERMVPRGGEADVNFGSASNVAVTNLGHAIQISWKQVNGSSASIAYEAAMGSINGTGTGSKRLPLELLQFHFHGPSEHALQGKLFPLEAHLVTRVSQAVEPTCPPTGCLAVFGILYEFSPSTLDGDELLDELFVDIPNEVNGVRTLPSNYTLDFDDLLPENLTYVTYSGSLTTPPCSEMVLWHVFTEPRRLSTKLMEAIETALGTTVHELDCSEINSAKLIKSNSTGVAAASVGNTTAQPQCFEIGARTNNRLPQPLNNRLLWYASV